MPNFLLVMIGGAIGAGVRYGVTLIAAQRASAAFPWGTWAVNLVGSLLAGLALGIILARGGEGDTIRVFILTGILGGFTTFSAFSAETAFMIFEGQYAAAAFYVASSVIGALLLTFLGLWLSGAGA
ncbi:MAG TPA: CrcB family protein [Allosphingosinicella sp.]|uniref:fluoride efflux transporter FluC n=1 Tax=Allosphingosinicella sp. TaxID=2823234 RepID=UPI002ED8DA02